jgi:predicted nuclease of predicted toxin-antitoxin system
MRILVDECLPRQLRYWLERSGAFEVSTVQDEGWANVKNGKLLRAANDAGYDVLLTADKNMHYQQNFDGLRISSVVVPTNRKKLVEKYVPALQQSLEQIQPGQKVVMDLGVNASVWHLMKIHAIEQETHHTTHKFKAPVLGM